MGAEIAVWADSGVVMEQAIDARQDEAKSVASNDGLVAVARKVSGAVATFAELSTNVEPWSDATAFAWGTVGLDRPGAVVFATAHRSAGGAAATSDRIQTSASGRDP